MAKSTLQKIAKEKPEKHLTGYIGTRVSHKLEAAFKDHCSELNMTVADALRLLIENELEAAGGVPAPAAPVPVDLEPAPVVSVPSAPADVIKRLEPVPADVVKRAPVELVPNKRKKKRGTFDAYKVPGPSGDLMPCPICKEFHFYKSFNARHTKKHGYNDTLTFLQDHAETVAEMLHTYNVLENSRIKELDQIKKEASEL